MSTNQQPEIMAVLLEPAKPGELVKVHIHHEQKPGDECVVCHRIVPKVSSDSVTGAKRQVLSLSIPKGEEGVLEGMLIQLVDKYKEEWPRDYAAMRSGIGLEVVGGRSWKYFAVHFGVYSALTLPIVPAEEGA